MKNTFKVEGVLEMVKRLPSSYNGNPRYLVSITTPNPGGLFDTVKVEAKTTVDSGIAYAMPNLFGKKVNAVIGEHYGSTHIWAVMEAAA
jgi:hypothetical protein